MRELCVVSNVRSHAEVIGKYFDNIFRVHSLALDELTTRAPNSLIVVDVQLNDRNVADRLRDWLHGRPKDATAVFVVDRGSHVQIVRAFSIGASDVVFRPVSRGELLRRLLEHDASTSGDAASSDNEYSDGIVGGLTALQHIFSAASTGVPLKPQVLVAAGDVLVQQIETHGFADWVQTVRQHHNQTYQHCLLVSGAAAAFAQHVGFSNADRRRVAIAGLLHDIGKAKVPVDILEKSTQLDADEMALMRRHTEFGHEALLSVEGVSPELLDMVLHHHERLDGSGYPNGLRGDEICDLTRIVMIADIFGALIELRPYQPPLMGSAAYQVLLDMGGQLDRDLVREFAPLSLAQFK